MGFTNKKTPITAKQVSAILGLKEKTIHNRGGGTAQLSRMYYGRPFGSYCRRLKLFATSN
jgi:hypothetical protein